MRRKILIVFLIAVCSGLKAIASNRYLGTDSVGTGGQQYGTSYSETSGAGEGIVTFSRHRRFGQETGIGSSTMQTTSATTEEMPTVPYKPTSMSPAIPPIVRIPALNEPSSFSSRMRSPAFSQPATSFPSLSPEASLRLGTIEQPLPTRLPGTGQFSKISGQKQTKGSSFERTLINPFEGL
jgi:hypothetical protein